MEQVPKDRLLGHLIDSLAMSGVQWRGHDAIVAEALDTYRKLGGLGHDHLPFHLVLDFTLVLVLGFELKFASDGAPDGGGGLEKIRLRYERECLGRLLQAREVLDAVELIDTSPLPVRRRAHLLVQLFREFAPHYPRRRVVNPAELRGISLPGGGDIEPDPADQDGPAADLDQFSTNVSEKVRWGELLRQEDRFELRHLEQLDSDHLRLGCRQTLELDRRLRSPRALDIDLTSHEDQADTAFLDETHYPTGGFAGLTNRGSFENLVLSELVYLDEGTPDFSLFELRYVESELLFYLRDSGNLRRRRRTVHFVIDLGCQFAHKPFGLEYQHSVVANGLCLSLMHDLLKLFELDALRFHFHYLPTGDRVEVAREMRVIEVILGDHIRHGWVELHAPEKVTLDELIDPRRKSYAIALAEGEKARHWGEEIQRVGEEELPLHVSVLDFGNDFPQAGELPTAEFLTPLKESLIRRLVGQEG